MEYDAFISYRHVERDAAVAGALQRALEHYHIPAQIQKQTGIKKIRRVFRDREELSTNTDLAKTLDDALDHSKVPDRDLFPGCQGFPVGQPRGEPFP
ncbi:MAG: toll/interleukin-1 receptor domain-containing protein [Lachnospiraceae bacterium]|nr:toll/interleukin-1 receptor domain-containing protein [Lachnospiraceae bacterium]